VCSVSAIYKLLEGMRHTVAYTTT